ncbi:MAG: hypothetical protein ACYDH9_04435 [Limisphaerales bacterium]
MKKIAGFEWQRRFPYAKRNQSPKIMRNLLLLTLIGSMLTDHTMLAQLQPPVANPNIRLVPAPNQTQLIAATSADLPRFNLDFPGGTPGELVKAIEKASGKPVNVIIPPESADAQLPPLKMTGVTVPNLFETLTLATQRSGEYRSQRNAAIRQFAIADQFRTEGPQREESIWYFKSGKPPAPIEAPKDCRYYQLAPHLETYKVEDITTAIETGWKMLGITSPPKLSFHKETKLLIAVGNPEDLKLIDDVLKQLAAKELSPGTAQPAKH